MLLHDIRDHYSPQTTLGKLFIDTEHFGETLEDTVRAYGIKVKGDTAIPANDPQHRYKVGLRTSSKFGNTIVIYTRKDGSKYYLEAGGISFMYILAHGGNDHEDTMGCPLVAKNRLNEKTIQGSLKTALYNEVKTAIDAGDDVWWQVTNKHQAA